MRLSPVSLFLRHVSRCPYHSIDAHRRHHREQPALSSRSSSSRPRPRGRGEAVRDHRRRCAGWSPSFVSVTYGAGGGTRALTVDIVKRIKNELGIEAMAHFTCVGHTREELHDVLGEMRDAGIENVLPLRGDPPKGETEFKPVPGGLVTRIGAGRADLGGVRLLHRRRLLPGGPPGGGRRRDGPAHLPLQGRRGRQVPDHAAVLRQRGLLRVRRAGPRERHRRADHPGHHADHELRADQALHQHVRRDDPACRCYEQLEATSAEGEEAVLELGRRLRDAAVRRPARPRRAGHPLLHAQQAHGDARDPVRAQGRAAVAAVARQRSG